MDIEKVVIIVSKSRYELELEKYGSEERAREKYVPKLWENQQRGHVDQKINLAKISQHFYPHQIITDRINLTPALIEKYEAFVFLGGDDHFTYCSQAMLKYLQENKQAKKIVFGTVLDPKRSWGGQLDFTVDSFIDFFPRLQQDDYEIEKWTALEAVVQRGETKSPPALAINHFLVAETDRRDMSRNYVYLNGKEIFPDKSSGIIVAVGAGSGDGSWYDNVYGAVFQKADVLPRQTEYARIFLTENKSRSVATLHTGEVLVIHSSNDSAGIVSPDSSKEKDREIPFPMGAAAEIKISSISLPVVRRK